MLPKREILAAAINNSISPSLNSNDWLRAEVSSPLPRIPTDSSCEGLFIAFATIQNERVKYRRARGVNWLCKQQSTNSCVAFNVNLMRVLLRMRSKGKWRHKSLKSLRQSACKFYESSYFVKVICWDSLTIFIVFRKSLNARMKESLARSLAQKLDDEIKVILITFVHAL